MPSAGHNDWDSFYKFLMDVYWPSVPPDLRFEGRPEEFVKEDDPDVPTDIYRAALMIFPDPEAWLDNPIPKQKRRTPLELLKLGREESLRSILMEVGPFYLPDPSEVRPWSDTESE